MPQPLSEAGIGVFFIQPPLAYLKKSSPGFTDESRLEARISGLLLEVSVLLLQAYIELQTKAIANIFFINKILSLNVGRILEWQKDFDGRGFRQPKFQKLWMSTSAF